MTGLANSASVGNDSLELPVNNLASRSELDAAPEIPADAVTAEQAENDGSPPQPAKHGLSADPGWREEVAARLARYRTRRKPRAPRYPSLFLPFDRDHRTGLSSASATTASINSDRGEIGFRSGESEANAPASNRDWTPSELGGQEEGHFEFSSEEPADSASEVRAEPEFSAKIIEFPRSAAIPIAHATPLADPVFDRPRIVEAPEIVPPPPALGGILIEPVDIDLSNQPAAAEPVPCPAPIARRLLAASVDAGILAITLCAFSAVFLRLNPIRGPIPLLAGVAAGLAVLLWIVYQVVFIVGTGSTLGLRAARLTLTRFDGSPVPRKTRRWRVLASFLSAFSAGLGYLWCLLDQDSLCWHDRITRTYLRPAD